MQEVSLSKEILRSIFTIYTGLIFLLGAIGLILFYYRMAHTEFPKERKFALAFSIIDIVIAIVIFVGSAIV